MEAFHSDVESLLTDSFTSNCLFAYDALSARYRSLVLDQHGQSKVHDSGGSSTRSKAYKKAIKFVPSSTVETDFLVGSLREFAVAGTDEDDSDERRQTATEPSSSLAAADGTVVASVSADRSSVDHSDAGYKPHRKRTKLILDAMKFDGSHGLARLETARKEKKIKSPSGTSSRHHSTGTDVDDVPIGPFKFEGSASARLTNNSGDNALPTNKNEDAENTSTGSAHNLCTDVSSPGTSAEIQPRSDADALQVSEPPNVAKEESSAFFGSSAVSLLSPGNGDGRGNASAAESHRPDGGLSGHVRQCLQIEKIGGFLGNLLPSKSIVFIINSIDNRLCGGR